MSRIVIILFSICLASFALGDTTGTNGTNEISSRIYGGRVIDIKEMPYMASLSYYGVYICSGSIVDSFFILTAAHCVTGREEADLSVRVGSSRHDSGGSVHRVDEVMIHPHYDRNTHENDVAVLFLYEPIILSASAQVIQLSNRSPKTGESVSVAGWGSVEGKKGASDVLRATAVTIFPKGRCKKIYLKINVVGENSWCAADSVGNRDTCDGDSGGPAVQNNKVVGVTSWGTKCGVKHQPGVYTDVSKVRDWIQEALSTYN